MGYCKYRRERRELWTRVIFAEKNKNYSFCAGNYLKSACSRGARKDREAESHLEAGYKLVVVKDRC